MEIQQLYYYMELCKQKNFTEAGYACNMTQGALSKQIRKLENELGITLIRRNTRKFELSKEGEIFLSYAKKMTGTYEEMLKNVQKNQEIKIGCMPVLAPYHFARLVADFRKEYPDIKLVIDERIASEIQENSDRYDFLILRENMMEDQKKFRFSQLYDDKLCAVLYEKHPLYGRDRLQLKELKDDFTTQTGTRLPLAKLLDPDFEKNARFFQKIAQIETSVPFNITLDQLKLSIDQQKRRQWYEYLEFYSLLKTA